MRPFIYNSSIACFHFHLHFHFHFRSLVPGGHPTPLRPARDISDLEVKYHRFDHHHYPNIGVTSGLGTSGRSKPSLLPVTETRFNRAGLSRGKGIIERVSLTKTTPRRVFAPSETIRHCFQLPTLPLLTFLSWTIHFTVPCILETRFAHHHYLAIIASRFDIIFRFAFDVYISTVSTFLR